MYKRIKALLKPSNASITIKRLRKENRTKIFEKEFLQKCGRNCEGDCFHHATLKASVARGRLTFRLRKKIVRFAMTKLAHNKTHSQATKFTCE